MKSYGIATVQDGVLKTDQNILQDQQLNNLQQSKWTGGELTVRCVAVIQETHDVKTFRFVGVKPLLFSFKPGQFVVLDLKIENKSVKRSYSISSTPSRPHTLDITVKLVPSPINQPDIPRGLVSNWLHDNLKKEDKITLNGAFGTFTCVDNPSRKLIFISAGSGITPMMSMSRYLLDQAFDVDIIFIHSARTPHDIIFGQELKLMAAQYADNFKLAITVTGSEQRFSSWYGYKGRLTSSMLEVISPDLLERTIYVCGSNTFMVSVKETLINMNFSMEQYHEESFGEKSIVNDLTKNNIADLQLNSANENMTNGTHIVVFANSGKEVNCSPEESLLEVAEKIGVSIPSACRSGNCGICKQKLIEGEVNYEQETNYKCEDDEVLCCVAKPLGKVAIGA